MITEITAAINSLKVASDIIKGLTSLKTDVAVKEKSSELLDIIISLQSQILLIQSEYSGLMDDRNKIEKELAELKNHLIDKENYILFEIAPRIFVYKQRAGNKSDEPEHFLCQNCFDSKSQKSVLQRKYAEHNDLICHSCGSTFRIADNRSNAGITFRP